MMKLQTYAGLSIVATLAVIYHAFSSRGQFYPAMVYLSTSKISYVLLLNMGLVIMCILWKLTKRVFLGSLREAEVERLNEQSWREVMEILFAVTIFRQDFSATFLAMVTTLLLIKSLHWMAQKRVEYIETTPSVPTLSHIRIISFLGFLLLVDSLFLYSSLKFLIQTRQASVSLFFSFEYMILATTTVSTFVKYVFYISDMLMDGQWERKAVYTFYLELIRDLLHLSLYMCFFVVIFMNYGVPLHLIRELYETFHNFRVRISDFVRYRKITSNMNDRFPDATPEELDASDTTCIICREELTTAKKLICGHLFHVHCLRSWLERQHTCPTCRALVVPSENGTHTARGHAPRSNDHQVASAASTSAQGSVTGGMGGDVFSWHQARLQAAASAAAIYEKSYVYPYASAVMCSSGSALLPQAYRPLTNSSNVGPTKEQSASGQLQHHIIIPGGNVNFPVAQFPHAVFLPSHTNIANAMPGERFGSDQNTQGSRLEAHREFLQRQIGVLENQLQLIQNTKHEDSVVAGPTASSDIQGKDRAKHGEIEEFNH